MFQDPFMSLVVSERLAEVERIGERARQLRAVERPPSLRARVARLLIAAGMWLEPRAGRPGGPCAESLPLTIWPGNR